MRKQFLLLLSIFLIISACTPASRPAVMPFLVTLTTPPPDFPTVVNTAPVVAASKTTSLQPSTSAETSVPNLTATYTAVADTPIPATYTAVVDTPIPATYPAGTAIAETATAALPSPTEWKVPISSVTYIPYVATPTETLLPPLDLPTEQSRPPAQLPWTGLPTYPADSDEGILFRVDYDPDVWAQTTGNFGDIVLANRQIPYCTITPWTGRGLPVEYKVTHEFRNIGSASFDVNTVTDLGALKFVSYVGGDHHVLTGFQVTFDAQPDACLPAAETVFGTLRSYAAIPTLTPTARPTP